MAMVSRLVGLALALAAVLIAMSAGGNAIVFINIPSLAFVVLLTLGLLVWSYGSAALKLLPAAGRMLSGNVQADAGLAAMARAGARFALMAGCVGTLIGMVSMLAALDDPSRMGGGVAIAFLALLYGVLLPEVIFTPLAIALQGNHPVPVHEASPNVARVMAGIVLFFSTTVFFVLLLSLSGAAVR
ncbi:MAG: hypothetical protein GC168_21715 [Candidatus Hydrogenedens sp.]|nr:hypothetical protein [Candidatus Hydrogenedens sp.]